MRPCVLAIGNFDGVHPGHAALISYARVQARALDLPLHVLTFDPLPGEYFAVQRGDPESYRRICTLVQRKEFLTTLEVDKVEVVPFTAELQRLTPKEFVSSVLVAQHAPQMLVVGADFRFGYKRAGDIALLEQLCTTAHISCQTFGLISNAKQHAAGEKYSSSAIRDALAQGKIDDANRLLGYSWQITGLVESGDGRGSELGFATANIAPDLPLPGLRGVFVASLRWQGAWLDAVANIGHRPTFGARAVNCEAHLLQSSQGNLYNQRVSLALHHKLRDERKFAGRDELVAQINTDVAGARYWHQVHSPVLMPQAQQQAVLTG